VTMRYKVKKEDWKELKRSIDARVLAALNGDLDCPGCADQPVEWAEVQFSDGTKRSVSYYAGSVSEPIADLLQRIRAMAEQSQISSKEGAHLRPSLGKDSGGCGPAQVPTSAEPMKACLLSLMKNRESETSLVFAGQQEPQTCETRSFGSGCRNTHGVLDGIH
jgi:hypothetical protein